MNDLIKAEQLLRENFGPDWLEIVQFLGTENLRSRVGKDLTSFIANPYRGNGGSSNWPGNCSPKVIEAVANYVLECKKHYGKDTTDFTMIDPMSGSGTSRDCG